MTSAPFSLLSHPRALVLLPSGGILDLVTPEATSWTDEDLALGLARTYRWGGHSAWPLPLSVAQHSLTVLAIREATGPLQPAQALYELLHDGEEGLLGFDCIAPLKATLGEPFRALCARLTAAIAQRYRLPTLSGAEYQLHKRADRIAAASEALHVVKWTTEQISETLGLTESALDRDPLGDSDSRAAHVAWEPWSANHAAARWLDRLGIELARLQGFGR